ncbi:MAG TPA: Xaa-Pro peptidase family protein [Actinomycetota bacterium]|nr:Xaa-Pro peptidase family protein [Actinomycetota bacterium]
MGKEHTERLRRAGEATEDAGLHALLVTPSADLVYLTGYDPLPLERLTCLVIRADRDPVLIVPGLERPLAEQRLARHVTEIRSWDETDDPYALVAGVVGAKASRLACTDRMWASHLLGIQRALPKARATTASRVLGPLRAVKDRHELHMLARAARGTDEAFRRLLEERIEGMTEHEVAGRLGELMLELGLDRVEFAIVGSGPNAASPHHKPMDRSLRAGDAVVMDFGGTTGGYCSDMTRTVVVGEASARLREVHEVVAEAQEVAVRAVRPGVPAEDVDRAARQVIERAGYGDRFIHRTGHGIGLEAHEDPYIVEGNAEPLRPGMCFSVEPGIYLEGDLGVRIEDIVVVTQDGARRLNHAPRELTTVR